MPTNFPTSLDSLTNPSSGDLMNSVVVPHSEQHANANDAIEALEAKLGVNNSTVSGSIDYLVKSASSYNPGHRHTTLFNTSGSSVVFSNASGLVFDPGNSGSTFIDSKANINFSFDRYLNYSSNFNSTYNFPLIKIDNDGNNIFSYGKSTGWTLSKSGSGNSTSSNYGFYVYNYVTQNLSGLIGLQNYFGLLSSITVDLRSNNFNGGNIFGAHNSINVYLDYGRMGLPVYGSFTNVSITDEGDNTSFVDGLIGGYYAVGTQGLVGSAYGVMIDVFTPTSSSQSSVGLYIGAFNDSGAPLPASSFVRSIHLAGTGFNNRILFGYTTSLYSPTASTLQVDNIFIASSSIIAPTISGTTFIGNNIFASTLSATTVSGTSVYGAVVSGITVIGSSLIGLTVSASTISGTNISGINISGATVSGLSIVGSTITANAIRTTTFTTTAITTNTIIASTISTTLASATVLLTPTITGAQVDFTGPFVRWYADPVRLGIGTSSAYLNLWMDSNSGNTGIGNNLYYNGTSWVMANTGGFARDGSGTAVILQLFPNATSGFYRAQNGPSSGLVGVLTWNTTGGITAASDVTINGLVIGRGGGNVNGNVTIGSTSANTSGGTLMTAIGNGALQSHTTGNSNTAIGYVAGNLITSQTQNTLVGARAGSNASGITNSTGVGLSALRYNSGSNNTAIGVGALQGNAASGSAGSNNVAIGDSSLISLISGSSNVGVGALTLYFVASGTANTAFGHFSMQNITSSRNVAIGNETLRYYTTVGEQVAIGYQALFGSTTTALNTGVRNTAVGYQALAANSSGIDNTAIGYQTLNLNASGSLNVAIGNFALANNLGNFNVAIGKDALRYYGDVSFNTAIGYLALSGGGVVANNTGNGNTALGYVAGYVNDRGSSNTFIGYNGGGANTGGNNNTSVGYSALSNNTSGNNNVAIGFLSQQNNTVGSDNVSLGRDTLRYYRASQNTAVGNYALQGNTGNIALNTGTFNTAVGYQALTVNTTGMANTAVGYLALTANTSGGDNTAVGYQAGNTNTTGSDNTYIGLDAKGLATGNWQIGIGSGAQPTASNLGTWGGNTNATKTDLGLGTFTPLGRLHIETLLGSTSGLIIAGAPSQSANYLTILTSSVGGSALFAVNASGVVTIGAPGGNNARLFASAANELRINNSLFTPSVTTNSFASSSVTGTTILAASALAIGALDTSMYRSSGGIIRTDTALNVGRRVTSDVVTLTDSASINTDALLGNNFRVTLGGSRSLTRPINPRDGQKITYEFRQDGVGGRTLTLDSSFRFGTDITSVTLSTSGNKVDFMTCIYTDTLSGFCVVGFIKGY